VGSSGTAEEPLPPEEPEGGREGLPWASAGFAAGPQVYLTGVGTRRVIGFDNSAYGEGTALLVDGAALSTHPAG